MALDIQVTFDCADPAGLSSFWAEALGYKLQDPPPGFESWEAFLRSIGVPEDQWNARSAVVDPAGVGPRIFFQRVPEPKAAKNRVHLDVKVGGGPGVPLEERRARVDAETQRLVGAGATSLQTFEVHGEYWVVLRDPEGNEFCIE